MATLNIEAGAAAFEWSTAGLEPPQMKRRVAAATVQIEFGTSGGANRKVAIPASPAELTFDTSAGSAKFVRKELLAGAGVELQVWDRADPQGTLLEVLRFKEQRFEVVLSDLGSVEILLPGRYLDSVLNERDHHVVVLVDGIERARFIAEEMVATFVEGDEKQYAKVVGRVNGAALGWGAVLPFDFGGPAQNVKRQWTGATRATALRTLFLEAKNRGTEFSRFEIDGWTGVTDSMGQPWLDLVDLEFDAGGSFLDLLMSWTEFGIEWLVSHDFKLQLATTFGRDLTERVVLYPAHTMKEQELSISRRDLRTVMYTQDGSGGVSKIESGAAIPKWGKREQYAVFSDALGTGTANANGYALLALIDDGVKERRVVIDPNAPGRRPFVDFDLGDVVGVYMGGEVHQFRVLAIAVSADESGQMSCEVTLEYMLEALRKRRQRLLNASSGGGGVSNTPQFLYATGGGVTVGTTKVSMLPMVANALTATSGKTGFTVIGTASAQMTVTVEIMYGEIVLEAFPFTVLAGDNTLEVTWLWTMIPQGVSSMRLRLVASTGTFTVAPNRSQFWLEAKSIVGRQTVAPIIFVNETVEVSGLAFSAVSDQVEATPITTTIQFSSSESVPVSSLTLPGIEDDADPTDTPRLVLTAQPVAAADGWAGASSFTATGSTTWVGNNGSESRASWFRFVIPVDLTNRTIKDAYLVGVANAAGGQVDTLIKAVDAAGPAAPVNRGQYDALTFAAPTRGWSLIPTAGGTFRSPSILNIVSALKASYGTMSSMLVVVQDAASLSGRTVEFRSAEYGAGSGMKLVIEYLDY